MAYDFNVGKIQDLIVAVLKSVHFVHQRGEITLPKEIRDACHLKPGVTLSVVPIGEVIMLIPDHSRVGEAAAQLENLRKSAGLTVEQMLEGLDEECERYYQKHYGN